MTNPRIFTGERTLEELRKLSTDDWDKLILPGTTDHLHFYVHGGEMLPGGNAGGSARRIRGRTFDYWRDEQDKQLCLRLSQQGDHVLAPIDYYANYHDRAGKVFSVARKYAEARGLKRMTLVGHSFGGSIAANIFYEYATKTTVRVRPQCLITINAMLMGKGLGGVAKAPGIQNKMRGPKLLVVGRYDVQSVKHAKELKKLLADATIREYAGGHSFDDNVGVITRWILEEV